VLAAPDSKISEVICTNEDAIAEARRNPEAARSLFALASYRRNDPESLERLRVTFANTGIQREFLSH